MADEFLGSGWSYPVEADHQGNIERSSELEKIEESIRIIIGTSPGERVMRPDYGCEIHDYVFSAVDVSTLTLMENAVEDALIEWEPRIDVEEVEAYRDANEQNRILIDIEYRVLSTNQTGNLVYPFYLEGEG